MTTTANDATLIALGDRLAAAIATERKAINAIPADASVDVEFDMMDAAAMPVLHICSLIEAMEALSAAGAWVKEMAARTCEGTLAA